MPGFTPLVGKNDCLEALFNAQDLRIGLFTNNSGLGDASILTDIDEPLAGNYASKVITAGSWVVADGVVSLPDQVFTPTVTPFEIIYGYYISKLTGELRHVEVDANAAIVPLGQGYIVRFSSSL